ncbi:MAG: penicillin-binding protein 1A, partial [bacterium]
ELTKNEILTLYANKIYLGKRAYGVEAAANVYYGKSVAELSLAEMAMIAGLPKAPSAFNPIANPKRAVIRRNWILGRMEKLGYIDNVAAKAAIAEPVTASYHGALADLNAPYVAEMARAEMLRMYGLKAYSEGFTVYTTVDSKLHESARSAVIKGLKAYDQRHGYRGAERHIPNPEKWGVALEDARIINGLIPAIVTEVEEKALVIQTKFGNQERLEWDQGLEGLRQFITENRRSSAMKDATEWFKPGDQIRISRKEDRWYLDQIPAAQAALVSLNPKDGGIRALVGGFSFEQSNYNRATQAERQPGSNFKPFIYATALENGFTAASVFNDAPIVFEDRQLEETWRPENDSGKFYGPTRLRKALYLSRNLVSIRLLKSLGIARGIIGAERFGFDGDALPRDLSLALGTHALPPLSIATGYATLANGGFKVEPYLISEVQDIDGNSVYKAEPATVCEVCEKPETTESEPIAVQHQGSATT